MKQIKWNLHHLFNNDDDPRMENHLKEVLTIAHEAGHGINNELMREKQNSLNFQTVL